MIEPARQGCEWRDEAKQDWAMPEFPFLPFLSHFRFSPTSPLPVFLFSQFSLGPVARPHRSERVSTLLTAQPASFRDLLLDGALRQTAAACDPAKHSVDRYGGIFGENTRFSVYTRYFGVTGH